MAALLSDIEVWVLVTVEEVVPGLGLATDQIALTIGPVPVSLRDPAMIARTSRGPGRSRPGSRRPARAPGFARYSPANSGETRSSTMRSAWAAAVRTARSPKAAIVSGPPGRIQRQAVAARGEHLAAPPLTQLRPDLPLTVGRSIAADAQQQIQSSHRLAYVSCTWPKRGVQRLRRPERPTRRATLHCIMWMSARADPSEGPGFGLFNPWWAGPVWRSAGRRLRPLIARWLPPFRRPTHLVAAQRAGYTLRAVATYYARMLSAAADLGIATASPC
jgi:hypothetical protein